jgi:hypothetical protein
MVPGFVSNNHPPIYTPVTRLVDPIGEFGVSVLLAVAFGVQVLRERLRAPRRRAVTPDQHPEYGGAANEMIVERTQ